MVYVCIHQVVTILATLVLYSTSTGRSPRPRDRLLLVDGGIQPRHHQMAPPPPLAFSFKVTWLLSTPK